MRFYSKSKATTLLLLGLSLILITGFASARYPPFPGSRSSEVGIQQRGSGRQIPSLKPNVQRKAVNFDKNDAFYGLSQSVSSNTTANSPRVSEPSPAPASRSNTTATPTIKNQPTVRSTTTVTKPTVLAEPANDHSGYEWLKPDEFTLAQDGEERKYTGNFPWWLSPLIALGLILVALLMFCTMSKNKNKAGKTLQRQSSKHATQEAAIEREIAQQLQQRNQNNIQNA
ncbi:unnamed protein product [Moneuplotes crassus]|uniref:Uncharacterized protein n=1 Tax=Euplotes crassus TaxID=5936 RepID=A0AAD2D3W8_EUPCR|nr:unnamed protein product [Moneuplotes crassus]